MAQHGHDAGATEIGLIPTDALINEIIKRHDAIIFAGKIHRNINQYTVTRRYSGHRDTCLAMCSNLASLINADENKSLGPIIE